MSRDGELLSTLRLIRTDGVGPVTFHSLVSFYGTAERALAALPELAKRGGRKKPLVAIAEDAAHKEIDATLACGAQFLMSSDVDYPALMRHVPDAPPLLIARGRTTLLSQPLMVGVVGARNGSANGCAFARKLAADLSTSGAVIISGLARGVDTAAHIGSMEGGTVAVIAGGIDHIYPPENAALHARIAEEGCIITEAPLGTAAMARHFPARNRIIAAASEGLVVIEASHQSGSLLTANDALEYGREVFAVPGSPMDARSHGCNDLIRQGATLTQSAEDVMSVLRPSHLAVLCETETAPFIATAAPPPTEAERDQARTLLLTKLGPEPVLLDELLLQCHISAGAMHMTLLELELAGHLARHAGGKVSRLMECA